MGYNESLRANSNYPPMSQSEWDDAPWNQVEVPDKKFEIQVSQTLVRTCDVITNKYIPGPSGVDYDSDDEGGCVPIGYQEPDDTSDVDWGKEYADNDHYTPLELINKFKEYLEKEWDALKDVEDAKDAETRRKKREIKHLIDECDEWENDYTEFEEV